MNFKTFLGIVLLSTLLPQVVLANNGKCTELQNYAKTKNINGQSNIPTNPFALALENRVYFHSAPDNSCKQEDTFVVSGDILYAYKINGGFTYVNYLTSKGDEVKGWVNTAELNYFNPVVIKAYKKHLNISDFIVINGGAWFGLGSSFPNNNYLLNEKEVSSEYIGDFPNEVGGLNKFYSHAFKGFNVIVSNVNYNERLWTIDDDYIVSNITLTTSKYQTIRNVKVGDKKEKILKNYIGNKFNESDKTITYKLGAMSLTFNLENDTITSIEMSSIPEQQ